MVLNPCGKSEIIDGDYYFPNCTMYYSNVQVYPNPASSEVTVSLKEQGTQQPNAKQGAGMRSDIYFPVLSDGVSQVRTTISIR